MVSREPGSQLHGVCGAAAGSAGTSSHAAAAIQGDAAGAFGHDAGEG